MIGWIHDLDVVSFSRPVEIRLLASLEDLEEFIKLHGPERVFALPDAAEEIKRRLGVEVSVVRRLTDVSGLPAALVSLDSRGELNITIVEAVDG